MRPIDADALIEFCAERWIPLNIDAVNMQPTIQPEKAQLFHGGTTSDLISRRAAIDAIAQCTNCGDEDTLREYVLKHSLDNGWSGGILEALDAVKDLPPAQPEPCGDKSYALWKESYEELKRRMDELTSCSDTISRQATIDAVNNAFDRETLLTGFVRSIAVRAIRDMPSAQPELTDEQAITHLQSSGWMQRHDKEMYESGLREQLADDSDSYDSLLPNVQSDLIEKIQAGITATNLNDAYSLGMRNGMRWCKSLIDGAEPQFEDVTDTAELLSVQPEPQEGHWIRTDCGLDVECKCSVCGYKDFVEPHDTYWFKRNYCPNCGVRMKGERQK